MKLITTTCIIATGLSLVSGVIVLPPSPDSASPANDTLHTLLPRIKEPPKYGVFPALQKEYCAYHNTPREHGLRGNDTEFVVWGRGYSPWNFPEKCIMMLKEYCKGTRDVHFRRLAQDGSHNPFEMEWALEGKLKSLDCLRRVLFRSGGTDGLNDGSATGHQDGTAGQVRCQNFEYTPHTWTDLWLYSYPARSDRVNWVPRPKLAISNLLLMDPGWTWWKKIKLYKRKNGQEGDNFYDPDRHGVANWPSVPTWSADSE